MSANMHGARVLPLNKKPTINAASYSVITCNQRWLCESHTIQSGRDGQAWLGDYRSHQSY